MYSLLFIGLILPFFVNGQLNSSLNDSTQASNIKSTADSLREHSRYAQAIASYNSAAEIFKQLQMWESHFNCRNLITYCKLRIGVYEEGIEEILIRQDSVIKLTGERSRTLAKTYNMLGTLYKEQGAYETASNYYMKALRLHTDLGGSESLEVAKVYFSLGSLHYSQGDYDQARMNHKNALNIRLDNLPPNDPSIARSLNSLGLCFSAIGMYQQALEHFQKSLRISIANYGESNEYVSFGYTSIASAHYHQGNLEESLLNFNKAIRLVEKLHGRQNKRLISPLKFRGTIYHLQERNEEALADFERLNEIALKFYPPDHHRVAGAKVMLADYHRREGNLDLSNELYGDAARIYVNKFGNHHPRVALYYFLIASNHFETGNYKESLEWNHKSLQANIPGFKESSNLAIPKSMDALSDLYLIASIHGKILALEALYEETQQVKTLKDALDQIKFGELVIVSSRNTLSRSQDLIELNETLGLYFSSSISVARKLWIATKDQKYLEIAFNFAEKGKSGLLLQSLAANDAKLFGGVPEAILSHQKELKEERARFKSMLVDAKSAVNPDTLIISQLQDTLFNLNKSFDSLRNKIKINFPRYHQLQTQEKVVSAIEVQNGLSGNSALIEYFYGDSATYVFTVSKNRIFLDTVRNLDSNQQEVNNFLSSRLKNLQGQNNAESFAKSSFEIYRSYLAQPVSHLDANIDHLIIIPDGLLSYIPFEVLITEDPSRKTFNNFRSLPYLLKKYQVRYGHSSTTLLYDFKEELKGSGDTFVAFAPSYNIPPSGTTRNPVTKLSYNVPEVSAINKLMKGTIVVDESVSEKRFKDEVINYDIIHLAMHAQVSNEDPSNSRLIFSNVGDSLQDNSLYVHEIYEMEIPSSLAVLSACETGSGKLRRGEGVMSLAHAFSYAGCPSIVMSHWSVDDKSTADVMKLFYTNLVNGMNKAEALQKAKLDFLAKANPSLVNPYYWGSFVLLGDDLPIEKEGFFAKYASFLIAFSLVLFVIAGAVLYKRQSSR